MGSWFGVARYVKQPRPDPTSEEFLALLILLEPFAFVVRWIWCCRYAPIPPVLLVVGTFQMIPRVIGIAAWL